MAYKLSGTGIIHELLDDEVIIANLNKGIYYSIRGIGVIVWQLIIAGHTTSSIEELITNKYEEVASISSFVGRLLQENLIIKSETKASSSPALLWPPNFEPPELERYDEMKNLLMLDPIHEVDEQGWPHQK